MERVSSQVTESNRSSEMKAKVAVSDSLQPPGLFSPWNSPGQNTGVGSLSLLQGIFPTQGWDPGLLHLQVTPEKQICTEITPC